MTQPRDAQGRFAQTRMRVSDGLANLASGMGTTADKRTYGFYTQPFMLPEQIEAAYRSSWFVQKGIDLPPFDMTRNRRDWQLDEADVSKVEKEEKRLQVWTKLRQALVLGRLGGGLIVMGVGNDPTKPLDQEAVSAGGLKYLHVMNRWQVSLGPIVTDPADPLFCQPAYFQISFGAGGNGIVKIHPSRVIAFRGRQRPNLRGTSGDDWFWGDSVLVAAHDAVRNADAAMNGFASLVEEAKLDTVTIPGLTQMVSTAEGEALVTKRVQIANQLKSSFNTRILDGGTGKDAPGEKWETRQVSWAGMPEIIRVYAAAVAGAFDIPATRFLGKSPDGMNATGTGDEANYIAKIRAEQDAYLRPALDQLDAALLPSAGVAITDEAWYDFPPLQEMSELDKATIQKTRLEAIAILEAMNVIPTIAFEKAMQHTAVEEQWLSGLDGALAELPDDERFPSEAEPDPNDPNDPNALAADDPFQPATGLGRLPTIKPAAGQQPARRAANDARFNDAEPKTLYVRRDVVNVAEIAKWAKSQGLPTLQPGLHVTIVHIDQPFDWMKIEGEWNQKDDGTVEIAPGGVRIVEPLGDRTAVLLFTSSTLSWRHEQILRAAGAQDQFPSYQPHISLTGDPVDLAAVEPYRGKIVLGPEIFEPVSQP